MPATFKPQQGNLLPYYWYEGEMRSHEEHGVPHVGSFSQAVDYSVVIFEGIRVNRANEKNFYGFRVKDHVQRMIRGWEYLQLSSPYSAEDIGKGLIECVQKNLEYLKEQETLSSMYVRPKFFVSDAVIKPFAGKTTHVMVECFPLGNYTSPNGDTATLADYIRTHRYSGYTTKGAGKYPEYGMIRSSTNGNYNDVLQLGLGKGGKLIFTEGTHSNVFFVKDDELFTPGIDDFILQGITRDSVLKMGTHLGMKVHEEEVPLSFIFECDEIFLTGTASFITPVIQMGKMQLGVGPVTQKLMAFFAEVRTGKVKEFQKWLTPFNL